MTTGVAIRTRLTILALACVAAACREKSPTSRASSPAGPTPDSFRVAFETTRGRFVVEAHRSWAPRGVDRLYALASAGLFDDNGFFRVVPRFIVQFGAIGDPKLNA